MDMQMLNFFGIIGDKTRLRIIEFLIKHKRSVCCDIAKYVKKDTSTTFRHIKILEKMNLIKAEKQGKFLICSLKNEKKIRKLFKIAKSFGGR